jgi:hypothetical protein
MVMKKGLLLLIMLLVPCGAWAENCLNIEYAELKDMEKVDLQKEYCKNKFIWIRLLGDLGPNSDKALAFCESQQERISRVYKNRFNEQLSSSMCTEVIK